jgi:hypothetical protein
MLETRPVSPLLMMYLNIMTAPIDNPNTGYFGCACARGNLVVCFRDAGFDRIQQTMQRGLKQKLYEIKTPLTGGAFFTSREAFVEFNSSLAGAPGISVQGKTSLLEY